MNATLTSNSSSTFATADPQESAFSKTVEESLAVAAGDTAFELGIWLSGLESFLRIRNYTFGETDQSKAASRDWSKEFRLTYLTLLTCSNLALRLGEEVQNAESEIEAQGKMNLPKDASDFAFDDIFTLSANLKNLVLLNEALLRAAPHTIAEWTSWSEVLGNQLVRDGIASRLIQKAEAKGEKSLPAILLDLFQNQKVSSAVEIDFQIILPYFGKVLKWLEVIGRMLENDEPLKLTLLIFARIYEQTQAMMNYLNNRLLHFPDEEDTLFGVLDGALYAVSIELRKVFNFELAGLAEMNQPVSIHAKIETSYALLNDCIQLILVEFAHFVDPGFEPHALFPNFKTKFEQSVVLRRDLWTMQQMVKQAEKNPDAELLEKLNEKLSDFQKTSLRFMMYKDCETFERFIEEVLRTRDKKDLVPILHRFGSYVETLFGQVNMRIVLANHPFEYPAE